MAKVKQPKAGEWPITQDIPKDFDKYGPVQPTGDESEESTNNKSRWSHEDRVKKASKQDLPKVKEALKDIKEALEDLDQEAKAKLRKRAVELASMNTSKTEAKSKLAAEFKKIPKAQITKVVNTAFKKLGNITEALSEINKLLTKLTD